MKNHIHESKTAGPSNILRKDLNKAMKQCLIDPRSPSLQLNRTPLILDEVSTLELDAEAYKLEETYMSTGSHQKLGMCRDENMKNEGEEEGVNQTNNRKNSMEVKNKLYYENYSEAESVSPKQGSVQQEFDPRSPSLGVDRTPIIFTDVIGGEEEAFISNEGLRDHARAETFQFASHHHKGNSDGNNISINSSFAYEEVNLLQIGTDENDYVENTVLKTLHNRLMSNRMRNYRRIRMNRQLFNRFHNDQSNINKDQQKIYEDQDTTLRNDQKLAAKQQQKISEDTTLGEVTKSKRNPLIAMDNCSDLRLCSLDPNAKSSNY